MVRIKLTGKTYHSVRIALEGKTFDTPKKRHTEILELTEIPNDLLELQEKNIVKIEIIS